MAITDIVITDMVITDMAITDMVITDMAITDKAIGGRAGGGWSPRYNHESLRCGHHGLHGKACGHHLIWASLSLKTRRRGLCDSPYMA